MVQTIITGLSIGLISGFHCVGMCGAIAFSLPVQHLNNTQKTFAILLYNAGRILTYTLLGLLFGWAGRLIFIAGYQQVLSIILGSVFALVAAGYFFKNRLVSFSFFTNWQNKMFGLTDKLFKSEKLSAHIYIGLLNGLLPCGMVYFAASTALATGSIFSGVLLMFAFGLGTLPLMMLISQFGFFLNLSIRNYIKKAVPYFVLVIGIMLIMRGLNLGIPYISPHFDNTSTLSISCH